MIKLAKSQAFFMLMLTESNMFKKLGSFVLPVTQ
jgi:hypothetical protein